MESIPESQQTFPSYWYKPKKGAPAEEGFIGATVSGNTVTLNFGDYDSTVNINLIIKIVSERQVLTPTQSRYTIVTKEDGETRYIPFSQMFFSAPTMKNFVRYLLSLNPNILLDTETRQIVDQNYEATDKIKFDFKVHRKKSDVVVVNSRKTQVPTILLVLLMFALFVGCPLIGDTLLAGAFGNDYPQYRMVLLFGAGILSAGCIFNLLMALQSKYKGHLLTFACLLLAIVCGFLAFI